MMSYSTKAFLLKSVDVGDADRICTLLTEDRGKIDAIAKGIRKAESKLASSVQPFLFLEAYVIVQRRNTLGGSVIIKDHPKLRTDPVLWWVGSHMLEIVKKMTPLEHRDPQLFSLLQDACAELNTLEKITPAKALFATIAFDLHVLNHLGMIPSLFYCVHCKQDKPDVLHLRSDGLYCADCVKGKPYFNISKETRTLLRFAQQKSIQDCLKVVCTQKAAVDAVRATRIFFEDHDALPLSTDKACKSLLQVSL